MNKTNQDDLSVSERTSKQPVRRRSPILRSVYWSLAILFVIAALMNWAVVIALLALATLAGLFGFVVKFRRDNRDLLPEGCSIGRFVVSAFSGMVRFIPGLIILMVAFGLTFAVDQVVNWGLDHASAWAETNQIITIKSPTKLVERHPLSPLRIILGPKKLVIKKFEVSKELSAATKWFVRTAINFLKLALYYPWLVLSFFTLQCYFYFWSRAFVARGGQVTMKFPKYQA